MSLSEAAVQSAIRARASEMGIHLFRNNVGVCVDKDGRHIRYGLANDSERLQRRLKSADVVGILPPGGRWVAVECKREGWRFRGVEKLTAREVAQWSFLELVRKAGGIADFCSGVEHFEQLVTTGRVEW